MYTLRWAWIAILGGSICVVVSLLWPEIPNPRANWTDQKASAYSDAAQEVHGLSHALTDEMQHAAGDPNHIHTPSESSDPRLTALELERARERSDALQAELEAARQVPRAGHLLLGLAGAALAIVGVVMAFASWGRA